MQLLQTFKVDIKNTFGPLEAIILAMVFSTGIPPAVSLATILISLVVNQMAMGPSIV
jgi:hypothetical protein